MIVVDLPDETATAALAARIAAVAAPADIIALKGDLGAGKTAFARAFIRACGNQDEVPSPTFTLVQVYDARPTAIWHFDLYRIRAPEEAWELGIEDAFITGISLIEWPERLRALLPNIPRDSGQWQPFLPGAAGKTPCRRLSPATPHSGVITASAETAGAPF